MPSNFGIAGAQPQKQVRFAPIYTGRWSSGLWTNRSPLRDANTTRLTEKFYGPSGDALIAGINTEITNRLTLARRPGSTPYDSNSYTNVKRFYSFRLSNATTEQILVMVDQANALYSTNGLTKKLVFSKSSGAGQSYMQGVGNTLYFADGVDNRKWLQTLYTWTANTAINLQANPFLTTFFIDVNGNMLELVGTAVHITGTNITAPTPTTGPILTVTTSTPATGVLNTGDVLTFPEIMVAFKLENAKAIITNISGLTITLQYPFNYLIPAGSSVENVNAISYTGGNPVTGSVQPVGPNPNYISDQVKLPNGTLSSPVSTYTPNYVIDNTAVWLNKGTQVETWGLDNSKTTPIFPDFSYDPAGTGNPRFGVTRWVAGTGYGAGSTVLDSNGNIQQTTGGGIAGTVEPVWSTILGQNTSDNTITWTVIYTGALTALNGGWKYGVAIVNSLDNTVSNISDLSIPTGNVVGLQGVTLEPGAGLSTKLFSTTPLPTTIDTQTDYVAIFRTTDGQSVPFLIPGPEGGYTLSLAQYMERGYVDTTPDTGLNNLISAPLNLENTIPQYGAKNLAYHLDRIFYSVGNVVYWTAGPDTPVGNGINGYIPETNFSTVSALVTRLVPTAVGLFVFTVSDVYVIQGNGTANSPLQGAALIIPGVGLPTYNALGMNGPVIGLFTTDSQFITIDPSDAVSYVGFPIGDMLAKNDGQVSTSWDGNKVYVTWHTEGEDQAWYLSDGQFGWFRLMTTPAPETGLTWSPYAKIASGGVGAVQSIETSPGMHQLMIGPNIDTTTILVRNVNIFADNGVPYFADAFIGSCVLAQPGQVAAVSFITTDSVKIGSPLFLGVLVDEALPYYTGPIDYIKRWEYDPPGLSESHSLYSQRFYMSDLPDEAATMRHCQIQISWPPTDIVQNELLSLTIFGTFYQEI